MAAVCRGGLQPERGRRAGVSPVSHVLVTGDLDSVKMATDVVDALGEGRDAELVVLELGVRRWRVDLVRTLCRGVHALGEKCAVYLPGGKPVGVGALNIGLCAGVCCAGAGVSVEHDRGDELGELVPLTVSEREQVERDLAGLLWMGLRRRGIAPEVSGVLARLDASVWGVDAGDRIVFSGEAPTAGGRALIEHRADGVVRAKLDESVLVRSGCVDMGGVSVAQVLLARTNGSPRPARARISSGLEGAKRDVDDALKEADRQVRGVELSLERLRRPIDDRAVSPAAFRTAGARALEVLERAEQILQQGEGVFEVYPELLRTPAPWGTSVGRTMDRNIADWRGAFLERRRRIERLRERAREYASR